MTQALEPRHVDPGAVSHWMRDGLRLTWRVAAGWLLVWYALAILALLAGGWTLAFVLIVGLSMPAFDTHVLMLDRAAANQHGLLAGLREAGAMLARRRQLYLWAGLWRMAISVIALGLWLGLLQLLGAGDAPGQGGSALPPWAKVLGLNWMAWGWAGLLPLVWQRHGITSFLGWLGRRHALPDEVADQLQWLARRKNPSLIFWLSFFLTGCGFLPLIFAPFLLPAFDIYHAAVMRCAWHDLFDGNTRVQAFAIQEKRGTASVVHHAH